MDLHLPPNKEHPPRLLTNLSDPHDEIVSFAEGSHNILENGKAFLGYGIQPYRKEFSPSNSTTYKATWAAQFGFHDGSQSYRLYKQDWKSRPTEDPRLQVERISRNDELTDCAHGSHLRGYVSWNGGTDITSFVVYFGDDAKSLKISGVAERKGFETKFVVPIGAKAVQVAAIWESDGQKATGSRRSNVVHIS